jgi:hypothetical protein
MDGKTATMIGAAALAVSPGLASAAQASAVPAAASYADLLEPIPNAVERLKAADQEAAARPPMLIEAQYVAHHHHHHHHHHVRAWYLQHGYGWFGGRWVLHPRRHHHHHHHHNY